MFPGRGNGGKRRGPPPPLLLLRRPSIFGFLSLIEGERGEMLISVAGGTEKKKANAWWKRYREEQPLFLRGKKKACAQVREEGGTVAVGIQPRFNLSHVLGGGGKERGDLEEGGEVRPATECRESCRGGKSPCSWPEREGAGLFLRYPLEKGRKGLLSFPTPVP